MSGIPLPSQVSRSHAGVRAAKLGIKLKKSSRMQLQAVFPGVPYISKHAISFLQRTGAYLDALLHAT